MNENYSSLILRYGRYGASKVKAFTVLKDSRGWITTRELCLLCGIGYRSLGRAVSRWVEWGYVARRWSTTEGGLYEYRLLPKGGRWLRLAESELMMLPQFRKELDTWLATLPGELRSLPFSEFVPKLDEAIKLFMSGVDARHAKLTPRHGTHY